VILEKFTLFPNEVKLRNKVADNYAKLLGDMVVTPAVPEGYLSSWAQYCVLAKDADHRAELQAKLKAEGIPSAVYYPKPLHQQTAFAHLDYKDGDFPVSEEMSFRIFALPMHPYMDLEDQEKIAEVLGS